MIIIASQIDQVTHYLQKRGFRIRELVARNEGLILH